MAPPSSPHPTWIVLGLAVAAVIAFALLANRRPALESGRNEPAGSAGVRDSQSADMQTEEKAALAAAEVDNEQQKREIEEFSESLRQYAEVVEQIEQKRRELREKHPLAEIAGHYGSAVMAAASRKYRHLSDEHEQLRERDPTLFKKMSDQFQALRPIQVFDLLESKDPVGDSTLGALVTDLLTNTDYIDSVRIELSNAAKLHFPDSDYGEQLSKATDLESLRAVAASMSVPLRKSHEETVAAFTSSREMKARIAELFAANVINVVCGIYEKSWTQVLEPLDRKREFCWGKIHDAMEKHPVDSPMRGRLAQMLQDYEVQKRNNQNKQAAK
jgi:hypothetical protein